MLYAIRLYFALVALLLIQPACAKVSVLANRTVQPVTVEINRLGEPLQSLTIPSGDSLPVFFQGRLSVKFGQGFQRTNFALQPANAYFFTRGADSAMLRLEQIGLGEQSMADPTLQLSSPDLSTALAAPLTTASITVKILVDDGEPTHRRIWEPKLRNRIAEASKILERQCGVRLQVVEVATWDSDENQQNFMQTLLEFEREVKTQPAQLAIGFTSQYQAARGRSHLGVTRWPMHSHILLRERSQNLLEAERLELLIHELGHYFGASHSPEPQSVMRPLLTRGLQRGVGSRITFDPVNALIVAMMGEEIRKYGTSDIRKISKPTKERLKEIYQVLVQAMPADPAARQYLRILEIASAPPRTVVARTERASPLVQETQKILHDLLELAKQQSQVNQSSAEKVDPEADQLAETDLTGDELTNLYVRQAAQSALRLRSTNAKRAMLLALGIFVDDATFLRTFPVTGAFVKQAESEDQRSERLAVLGKPTMRERTDLTKHFFVSAHLQVAVGKAAAISAGLAKEMSDSQGGTGFSFVDMAANRAGIVFAEQLLAEKLDLAELAEGFHVDDFLPTLRGLEEGLTAEQLKQQFGGDGQPTIAAELEEVEQRVLSLPKYDQLEE